MPQPHVRFERDPADVLRQLHELRAQDVPTHGGRVLAYVYDPGVPAVDELAAEASRIALHVNGLDPTAFPSVARMEADLVRRARDLLGGDDEVVGSVTSGGTESCLLAVKTARDAWRAAGGEGRAQLVLPVTAHPAFHKAAHYLDLEVVRVPVDGPTGAVTAAAVDSVLGPRVALVVVSAPSYPYGVLDPVAEVAGLAAAQGIACHVDACIGGWVLPYTDVEQPWDLSLPGVTSLSVDLHKYGYVPKGASLLLHRGRDRARLQSFALASWPGYAVVNPSMLGSKPAAPLAAAWAVAEALGDSGYRALAGRALAATARLVEVARSIPGLRVVGEPAATLFAVTADQTVPVAERVDPHHLADAARARGWVIQPQPALQTSEGLLPRTAHLTVTAVTLDVVDELAGALVAAADDVRGRVPASADPGLMAAAAQLDPATLDAATAQALLGVAGLESGGALPAELAPLMALIEQLPPGVTERLLTEYLARLIEP
ncbi:pyridoxal phosphate-dependent decarboxylase family protein [Angustibacter luteus]|uniref:Pyridoxal phosphate-dependent decarboxylase family protein n=1 Tax=Angustibacter luteus TaxID=658456 RepID=A0ABW1J9A1_9ACTN